MGQFLGPALDDLHAGQTQPAHDVVQPGDLFPDRFQQRKAQIRKQDLERNARKTRARTYIQTAQHAPGALYGNRVRYAAVWFLRWKREQARERVQQMACLYVAISGDSGQIEALIPATELFIERLESLEMLGAQLQSQLTGALA